LAFLFFQLSYSFFFLYASCFIYNMMWRHSFLVLSVWCSKSILYVHDHLFPKICKISAIILLNIFYVLKLCTSPLLYPWISLFFCVPEVLYVPLILIFLYYCMNVLIHLSCVQALTLSSWVSWLLRFSTELFWLIELFIPRISFLFFQDFYIFIEFLFQILHYVYFFICLFLFSLNSFKCLLVFSLILLIIRIIIILNSFLDFCSLHFR
jgi:hypothetical protein